MTRTTNILGFAFLAMAVTMTAMITMRNSPRPSRQDGTGVQAEQPRGRAAANTTARRENPAASASTRAASVERGGLITFAPDWLASLAADERQEWLARAAAVERGALERLDRLTEELDLSRSQRAKLFPALARSAPDFDPAMMIAGQPGHGDGNLTPAEEIHALLDQDQRHAVEDAEVSRQLWWQAVLDRLEADLTSETGGAPVLDGDGPSPPPHPVPDGDREAPESRDDANLFDLLNR